MIKGKIIIISGPSGSGKTTLYKKLLLSPRLKGKLVKTISVTTRPKRIGEKDGREYRFISKKMFSYKKKERHFLESQKVFDNYYGTPKKDVEDLFKAGKNILLCIDVKGARVVYRQYPSAIKIFIKAPSWESLKKRLEVRGSENQQVIKIRLRTARKELREAKRYDYVIVNDNLIESCKKLEEIVCSALGIE